METPNDEVTITDVYDDDDFGQDRSGGDVRQQQVHKQPHNHGNDSKHPLLFALPRKSIRSYSSIMDNADGEQQADRKESQGGFLKSIQSFAGRLRRDKLSFIGTLVQGKSMVWMLKWFCNLVSILSLCSCLHSLQLFCLFEVENLSLCTHHTGSRFTQRSLPRSNSRRWPELSKLVHRPSLFNQNGQKQSLECLFCQARLVVDVHPFGPVHFDYPLRSCCPIFGRFESVPSSQATSHFRFYR